MNHNLLSIRVIRAHTVARGLTVATRAAVMLIVALLFAACDDAVVSRQTEKLSDGWAFMLTDTAFAYEEDFDDSGWRTVRVPHDWSIEGEFSQDAPAGVRGGFLPGGTGWYRKRFDVTDEDLQGRVLLRFDGVYMNASVFVNGIKEGRRPYGYSSFAYDITPDLRAGSNVIAVKVENNEQPNSRWYTGSGIYRHVWLTKTGKTYVPDGGTCVRTPLVNKNRANIEMTTSVTNAFEYDMDVDVHTIFRDPKGRRVAQDVSTIRVEGEKTQRITQSVRIDNPVLWDVDAPRLYAAETILYCKGKEVDRIQTRFGIRSFYFDETLGFIFNDRLLKINGVCLHHDLGCLGTAVSRRAIERQLQMLKNMGCNAIRTSHNPPAPELLDLCDELGLLVIDEAFDVWRHSRTTHDYAQLFDEWADRDLADMVVRDRNHPSVIVWSIGNEAREQWDTRQDRQMSGSATSYVPEGTAICRRLADIVHRLDPTRPVTAGANNVRPTNNLFRANALDIIGLNYNNDFYDSVRMTFSGKPLIITESNSALMTRGCYQMPSTEHFIPSGNEITSSHKSNKGCSSYDHCFAPGGSTHERTMLQVRDNPFVCGQFVWTGFDYIGEPTPFDWPARSSNFGIIDLAGFPKDVYYLYQSEWQTEKTVLHLFPHWNWKEGEEVDLWCYFNNADEVELFINDRSKGVRNKGKQSFHVMWRVPFEPGVCRVVSRKDKKVVAERYIATAERPARLRVTPDRHKIHADGEDLCFVTVEVVDRNGTLCPFAQNDIHFYVEGSADIEAVDNGCPFSLEPFRAQHRLAFAGKCLVVLRSSGKTGNARLVASADGLASGETTIHCLDDATY